jgi:hypothetical protein
MMDFAIMDFAFYSALAQQGVAVQVPRPHVRDLVPLLARPRWELHLSDGLLLGGRRPCLALQAS